MGKLGEPVERFSVNREGRDLAVGDIHGHFSKLMDALIAINFDPRIDRLFSVGDLVDRGPECREAIKWINYPWFHPVRGNHDNYVAHYETKQIGSWLEKSGKWFTELPPHLQEVWGHVFDQLPIVIQVLTPDGYVGIVHADCIRYSWSETMNALYNPPSAKDFKLVANTCMYNRRRIELQETDRVSGVKAMVVGHTPVKEVTVLGNVYHIDTAGWTEAGHFTLLNLHTLEVEKPQ